MNKDDLIKFNRFRELCLKNSEDAIKTADSLQNKNVNHIVLQLVVFGLEEIGKIFIGWYQLNAKESGDKENTKIPMDDHIKKLFWAIWGPSFTKEKITKEQIDKIQSMASQLHDKRLSVMYTELTDTIPSSDKITSEEVKVYLNLAKARLEIALAEGEVDTNLSPEKEGRMRWFMEATNETDKRNFIFSNTGQEKLIEIGDVSKWIDWLKEHFKKETEELTEILQKEIENSTKPIKNKIEPKWKIRIKVISPSHSIRANLLNSFNAKDSPIKFTKGGDNHTLLIDFILDKKTPIQGLWQHGWVFSKLLVTALNVGSSGFFYWNIAVDVDRYYETIWDVENKRPLEAKLTTNLQLDWSARRMVLSEEEITLSLMIFRYFSSQLTGENIKSINDYMTGLGMLAKNDMHLSLEKECFLHFFQAFQKAILQNEDCEEGFDIKDLGFRLLEKMLENRKEFDNVMDIGIELQKNPEKVSKPITLTEIIGMKHYSGLYFVTLAVRNLYDDNSLLLTKDV